MANLAGSLASPGGPAVEELEGMFAAIVLRLMALVAVASGAATAPTTTVRYESAMKPRAAQARLARVLREADAIESVTANGRTITFVIAQRGETLRVIATTRDGSVRTLAVTHSEYPIESSDLTWLASELADVAAITRLDADEDGAVTITTSDLRRYMIIPGRGSGGPAANAAAEARWAASWNS